MHSTWATLTNFLGIIIAVLMLVSYFSSSIISRYPGGTIARITGIITRLAQTHALMIILALCVIISITVTGALGAVIVHGPQVDPVVNFIYTTLIPQG